MEQITVDIKVLKRMCKTLEKEGITEVSFEFLVGSCFPHIMDNIKEELRKQHAMGYAEGLRGESEKNE